MRKFQGEDLLMIIIIIIIYQIDNFMIRIKSNFTVKSPTNPKLRKSLRLNQFSALLSPARKKADFHYESVLEIIPLFVYFSDQTRC